MAAKNIGKITQIIGAVLDVKYAEGKLPEINEAIKITRKDGTELVHFLKMFAPSPMHYG